MRMSNIIAKKRYGKKLTREEIHFFIKGVTEEKIPTYQTSALLMAIVFQGMDKDEIAALTEAMMHSGDVVDLSSIKGITVDKHSTGGVGDKTSLVIGPLVASCGAKLAKMSGRGLGHTGGTLDKLESIPNMSIDIEIDDFVKQVNDIGLAIIGQTADLVPADKILYALRDVTATVESIPLIASSIMSKKLASGTDTILLDVKFGSGAFMKTIEEATKLAQTMVEIGDSLNRDTKAMLTNMNQPLGLAIGNNLEVIEAIETLRGGGPDDLVEICLTAVAIMLYQAKIVPSIEKGRELAESKIADGSALEKLREMVIAQGGDPTYIDGPEKFPIAQFIVPIVASESGYVEEIDSLEVGVAGVHLGAGRETIEDAIDPSAGIVLNKKVGSEVSVGDILAHVHTNRQLDEITQILENVKNAFKISKNHVETPPVVYKVIE
ncbi:MAG: pyrimidine-nucleoside phosphorylase [Erysipelotrichaceae bacterium]|nr:pyrimidine-nucleoside phosphorylase [Erysipelotrichaceae bacterium]